MKLSSIDSNVSFNSDHVVSHNLDEAIRVKKDRLAELEDVKDKLELHKGLLKNLKENLEATKKEHQEVEESKASLLKIIIEKTAEADRKTLKAKEADQILSSKETNIQSLEKTVAQTESKLAQKERSLALLEKDIEDAQAKKTIISNDQSTTLSQHESDLRSLQRKIADANFELETAKQDHVNTISTYKQKIYEMDADHETHKQTLKNRLKDEQDEATNELVEIQTKIDKATDDLKAIQKEIESKSTEMNSLKEKEDELAKQDEANKKESLRLKAFEQALEESKISAIAEIARRLKAKSLQAEKDIIQNFMS